MGQPDLLMVCVSAFLAVFLMLSALAGVMRVLIAVFPERTSISTDAAILAAVTAAVSAAYPGAKISTIEETQ